MNLYKLITLVTVSVLLSILLGSMLNGWSNAALPATAGAAEIAGPSTGAGWNAPALGPRPIYLPLIVLNAPGVLNCLYAANGISVNYGGGPICSGDATFGLAAGGIINSGSGFGLRVNSFSAVGGEAALLGREDGGSGLPTGLPAGVWGDGNSAVGVYGTSSGGSGIVGQSAFGYAVRAQGSIRQDRDQGGVVKAMVLLYPNPGNPSQSILRCFNGQGAAPNRTAPCGYSIVRNAVGDHTIDFGFQVNDRFLSVTPWYGVQTSATASIYGFFTANSVRILTHAAGAPVDAACFVVVY